MSHLESSVVRVNTIFEKPRERDLRRFFFFFNWNIIDLWYYVSFWFTTYWFNILTHYKWLPWYSVTICYHTEILKYNWLYFPHYASHPHDSFILYLETCVFLHLPQLFHSPPPSHFPLAISGKFVRLYLCIFVLCIYETVSVLYLFLCFVF